MRIITVKLGKRSYDILLGQGIVKLLGKYIKRLNLGADAYVITNPFLKSRYGKIIESSLKGIGIGIKFKCVADTEKSKSFKTAQEVIVDLARFDKNRKIFILAFGGGVVGDLSGFIASIYKRGVSYAQVPTTLLAQVDSAIGGKTALDLPAGKNLVGAFYQPRLVLSDTLFLRSLDLRQIRCGLAEVIKYGLICDSILFSYLERNHKKVLQLDPRALEFIIVRSAAAKARIVEVDEKDDSGVRMILNFGHTIGHAIEAAGGYGKYTHGEAISLGMLVAADISRELKLTGRDLPQRIGSLLRAVGLPTVIRGVNLAAIVKAHYHDKKFIGARNRLVLLRGIGKTRIEKNVPLDLIIGAIKKRSGP